MLLILKMLIGALAVLLISIFAKSKNFYIAGLIPLFPTFAMIANIIVYNERSITELKQTILFSIFSLVPYFIYLIVLYISVDKITNFYFALSMSVFAWSVATFILVYLWKLIM